MWERDVIKNLRLFQEEDVLSYSPSKVTPPEQQITDTAPESAPPIDFVPEFLDAGKAKELGFTEADADPEQLRMGIEVETEHTSNPLLAKKIALDHLAEIKDYYSLLKNMEDEAKSRMAQPETPKQ